LSAVQKAGRGSGSKKRDTTAREKQKKATVNILRPQKRLWHSDKTEGSIWCDVRRFHFVAGSNRDILESARQSNGRKEADHRPNKVCRSEAQATEKS